MFSIHDLHKAAVVMSVFSLFVLGMSTHVRADDEDDAAIQAACDATQLQCHSECEASLGPNNDSVSNQNLDSRGAMQQALQSSGITSEIESCQRQCDDNREGCN
jgi:hypothetical protein